MYGYFCITFIDFLLKGKSSLEHSNFFSPNDYKENEIIKPFCNVCKKYIKFKNPKISYIF